MPVTLLLDRIELESDTVGAITMAEPGYAAVCPPYPDLNLSGNRANITLTLAILENDSHQITLCLDLGGRILSWYAKETETWVIPNPLSIRLESVPSGRGLIWRHGIEWSLSTFPRFNGLGPVEHQFMDPSDDVPEGGILLHELELGSGLSSHVSFILGETGPPRISVRVANRGFRPVSLPLCMALHGFQSGPQSAGKAFAFTRSEGNHVVATMSPGAALQTTQEQGTALLRLFPEEATIAPRDVLDWSFSFDAISGIPQISAIGQGIASEVGDGIALAVTEPIPQAKVVVFGAEKSVEAIVDLSPDKPFVVEQNPLDEPIQAVRVDDEGGATRLWWRADGATEDAPKLVLPKASAERLRWIESLQASSDWSAAVRDPELRNAAHIQLAYAAIGEHNWEAAGECLDAALGVQASDALTWWLKAVVARKENQDELAAEYLPNAHFLAPMEPALRAEAFLSQPQTHGSDPNPVVAPIGNHPDAQLAVVHLLLEANLWDEAVRWMDECLRHRKTPLISIVLAWCYFTRSRMAAEAAQWVAQIDGMPHEAPFPWRPLEIRAVNELAGAFPSSKSMVQWSAIAALASQALDRSS